MPIIEGIPEPQFGDTEKREQDNLEYNKKPNISLKEQKANLAKEFYGQNFNTDNTVEELQSFQNSATKGELPDSNQDYEEMDTVEELQSFQNTNNAEQKEEIKEVNRDIDEHPTSPLVDAFVSHGDFTIEEGESVKKALILEGDTISNIESIDGLDEGKITEFIMSIEFLEGEKGKSKCSEKFNKDFSNEVENLKQDILGEGNIEKELSRQDNFLVEKLGGNYLRLEISEGSFENKNDVISRAFKITLNELMDGKNFKRPDTFDEMKNIVNNSDLSFEERFSELKKIDTLINTDQSLANGKQAKNFNRSKEGREKLNLTLEEKFNELKEDFKKVEINNNNEKQLKDILLKADILKKETESSGDIFIAGDLDKLTAEINNTLKEQT